MKTKRTYRQPTTEVVGLRCETVLLAGSGGLSKRSNYADGGEGDLFHQEED
ncbi:MAG: hypothetical protein IJ710_09475 [Prevotella sp.]|nr:hypothetical protein [Prevotella sp.]